MPGDGAELRKAARKRSLDSRSRAEAAIVAIERRGDSMSFAAVAERAHVSRQWLYTQSDLRERIEVVRADQGALGRVPRVLKASEESVRARLAVALDDNQRLREDIKLLKAELALALGEQRRGTASRS